MILPPERYHDWLAAAPADIRSQGHSSRPSDCRQLPLPSGFGWAPVIKPKISAFFSDTW